MANKYQTCPHCKTVSKRPYDKKLQRHEMRRQCPECGAQYERVEKDRRLVRWVCPECMTPVDPLAWSLLHYGMTTSCDHCGHELPPAKRILVEDRLQSKLPGVTECRQDSSI